MQLSVIRPNGLNSLTMSRTKYTRIWYRFIQCAFTYSTLYCLEVGPGVYFVFQAPQPNDHRTVITKDKHKSVGRGSNLRNLDWGNLRVWKTQHTLFDMAQICNFSWNKIVRSIAQCSTQQALLLKRYLLYENKERPVVDNCGGSAFAPR